VREIFPAYSPCTERGNHRSSMICTSEEPSRG
jgi:hypothetical protein